MNRDQKQTVTLNLAINVDVTQLIALLKNYNPAPRQLMELPEPAITLAEAAELLNCSQQKVRDLVREGRIPNTCAFCVGSLYRFHRSELIDWFQNSPRTA